MIKAGEGQGEKRRLGKGKRGEIQPESHMLPCEAAELSGETGGARRAEGEASESASPAPSQSTQATRTLGFCHFPGSDTFQQQSCYL